LVRPHATIVTLAGLLALTYALAGCAKPQEAQGSPMPKRRWRPGCVFLVTPDECWEAVPKAQP
jgi:hypothetical protein